MGNPKPSDTPRSSQRRSGPRDGPSSKPQVAPQTQTIEGGAKRGGSKDTRVALPKELGLFSCIAMLVGTMIGSGIFVSPGGVLQNTQSVWTTLLIWLLCGIISAFGGITYIELSTVIPDSGAEYSYINQTFGSLPGFVTIWTTFVMLRPAQIAVVCLSFAEYAIDPFISTAHVKWGLILLTCVAVGIITFANCWSTSLAAKMQIFFLIAKLGAVAIIIIAGIYNLCLGRVKYLALDFEKTTKNMGKIATAFFNGLWAFDGWNQVNLVVEEVKDPYRNIPRSVLIGIPLVAVVYMLMNISFLTIMSPEDIAKSTSVANLFGQRMLGVMSFVMPLSVVMSTFGAANGTILGGARMSYVAGREGHLPDVMSYISVQRKTPIISLVANSIVAVILILILDINELIDFLSFAAWIFYGASGAAMIILRYKRPDAPRPFKAPIFMAVVLVVASAFLVIAPIVQHPAIGYLAAAGVILFGVVLYFPFVYFHWVFPGTRKWVPDNRAQSIQYQH